MEASLNNQFIALEVDRSYGDNEDFFRLISPEGHEVILKKLPFQLDQPLPERLSCRVKRGFNGEFYYTHNVPKYVREFYAADHAAGKDFEFIVRRVPGSSGDPYILVDRHGIEFQLRDRSTRLSRGQTVRCSFARLDSYNFSLQLSDHNLTLPLLSRREALQAMRPDKPTARMLNSIFDTAPYLEDARNELALGRAGWILTALRAINTHLSDIFVNTDMRRHHHRLSSAIKCVSRLTLYLVENSAFLRGTRSDIRHSLQQELTVINENLLPCLRALDIIVEGNEKKFISNLLDKLRKSGFLYHPTLQFTILMLIFRHRPEHVGELLGRIYDVIMEWNLPTWTNEPFRSAFVEQFELYIKEMRRTIDQCPQADTPAEKTNIENMLKALALQQCIADPDQFPHYNRNRSLFYRYVSLLRPANAGLLIDKSFDALAGDFSPKDITYINIKEPALMMTQAALPTTQRPESPSVKRFRGSCADIELHGHQITIRAHKGNNNTDLLPAGMISWLSPEIIHGGIKRFTPSSIKKIKSHEEFWNQLTTDLTAPEVKADTATAAPVVPSVGDDVLIQIDSVDADPAGNNPRFNCHIDDVNFVGKGFFRRSSLVGYLMKSIDRSAIINHRGEHIHLIATVIGGEGDNLEFGLQTTLHEWIEDNVMVGQEVNAVIASYNQASDCYSAISELGIGLLLHASDDLPDSVTLGPQTVVRAVITQTSDYERVHGQIVGLADPNYRLGKDKAIAALLANLEYREDLDETDEQLGDEDETLSREDLHEIIELFRLKAVGSDEVMKAYDTLRFGCLLADIIGDSAQVSDLGLLASLLQLHVDFADNRRVDTDKLEAFRHRIQPGTLAERFFRRMEMVSWLGTHEHDDDLWHQTQAPDSELEGKFARMILSYNMLVASALQENDYARKIKDDICSLLKVNNEHQSLKYYGCESQFTEFKSSMVFCANDGIKRTPEESLTQQTFEIMHIIAGFMNTTGGKLYIGVSDSHYERGLDEDFKALRLPQSPDLLKRMDELLNYLTMRVAETFGRTTSTLVHIAVDEESVKGVLVVTVNASRQPIWLNDTIYVRLSTSTVAIKDRDQVRNFVSGRATAYDDMMRMLSPEREQPETAAATETATPVSAPPADNLRRKAESLSVAIDVPRAESLDRIATSQWRPNVLHDDGTSPNYVVPELYIYFIGEHHYTVSKDDYYTDNDPACRLALAVRQSELDAYLVLAYEGEQLIKVPVGQLLEKTENRNHRYWSDARLLWATVAHDNDAILSIHADSSGSLHYRATLMTEIAKGSMTNPPARLLSVAVARTEAYELIDAGAISRFEKGLTAKLNNRQTGFWMRTRLDMPDCRQQIDRLIAACK